MRNILRVLLVLGAATIALFGTKAFLSQQSPPAEQTPPLTELKAIESPKENAMMKSSETSGSIAPTTDTNLGQSPEILIRAQLEKTLGRAAGYDTTYERSAENWQIICGRPKEASGEAFDYTSTAMKERIEKGAFENQFCALIETQGERFELAEFSLGDTDSPLMDWMIDYDLPNSLLK